MKLLIALIDPTLMLFAVMLLGVLGLWLARKWTQYVARGAR